MSSNDALAALRDSRLAVLAISQAPAWLWSIDGTRVLWGNAAGVVALGAETLAELLDWQFAPTEPAAAEVLRLAETLDASGTARLERLHGFGDRLAGMSMCSCSHVVVADGTPAILIASTLQMRHPMPLAERMQRLLDGLDDAAAAFAADGMLLHANAGGEARLKDARSIGALGAATLAQTAIGSGAAAGETSAGAVELIRLGGAPEVAVLARFEPMKAMEHAGEAAARIEAPPAPLRETQAISAETSSAPAGETPPAPPVAAEPGAVEERPVVETAPTPPIAETPIAAEPPAPPPIAQVPTPAPEAPMQPAAPSAPLIERRHPLRFVWQMDRDGHFTIASEEFIALAGDATANLLGRSFEDINAVLDLDPAHLVARAIATRDTWSGITLAWPIDDDTEPLKVELSGLPVYDRDRTFVGYRGFGVCRNVEALAALARRKRGIAEDSALVAKRAKQAMQEGAPPTTRVPPAAINVVPFRAPPQAANAKGPELSPGERVIFSEIAQRLSARLKPEEQPSPPAAEHGAGPAGVAVLRTAQGPGIDGRKNETRSGSEIDPSLGWFAPTTDARKLVDRLPLGILIYHLDTLIYANRAFLDAAGCADLAALNARGGLDSLFVELSPEAPGKDGSRALTIRTGAAGDTRISGRLFSIPWGDASADIVVLGESEPRGAGETREATERERRALADQEKLARAEAIATERANLLAMISHDVRTPLTNIIGFAETMLDEHFGPIGNERYRKYLNDIRASGIGILSLFDNVVSLATTEPRGDVKADKSVDMNATVQECVARMQPEASRARVLIRTALAQSLPRAEAASDAVRQIIHILLANSIKFAGAGSQVIVSTASSAGKIILRLRDTGTGLNARDLAAALAPLDTTTQSGNGSLSFAVARTLAEANGGTVAISSRSGEGTLVEVLLRAHAKPAP